MEKKTMAENYIHAAYEKGVFAGTWLLAENGEIVTNGAVGFRDPEGRLPMREDSIFDIGSVSKQFTAAAIMLLRRDGLLNLEDEITKFYPEIPFRGITIRHLLTHTSGLPDCFAWMIKTAKADHMIPDNGAVLRFLTESGTTPDFLPGEQWAYSNTGYALLAEIVAKVSGVPFAQFLQKKLLFSMLRKTALTLQTTKSFCRQNRLKTLSTKRFLQKTVLQTALDHANALQKLHFFLTASKLEKSLVQNRK